eukprot:1157390-Pelagomonas_calceolata.AAC.9
MAHAVRSEQRQAIVMLMVMLAVITKFEVQAGHHGAYGHPCNHHHTTGDHNAYNWTPDHSS